MAKVVLTFGIEVDSQSIENNLKRIINQVYKLLPLREQHQDWQKPLETIIEQLTGMSDVLMREEELFFSILCKMKGLFSLNDESDMVIYRRTILEILSLLNTLKNNVCN